jgi:CPA2 family monovalent cation:H+ antiporter-2
MSWVFIELGAAVIGLALLARLAHRLGFSAIPLYLLGGLAFGNGGLLPLRFSEDFLHVGAEVGVILLLFMLGLEYSGRELRAALRASARAGVLDAASNFTPGFVAGLVMGWGILPATFLGGITFVSSSGIAAKLMRDLGRRGSPETGVILSILVLEDLAMAVYLPILGGLLVGGSTLASLGSAALAVLIVLAILGAATRLDIGVSRVLFSHSDEALLLTILGFALLLSGAGELLDVSAAVGALLAGIVLSGPAAERAHGLLSPVRDLFAALFFAFIGLDVDPTALGPALAPAALLALLTALTKVGTGWWSARWAGLGPRARLRAGTTLVARGEFSIAIAGLAASAGLDPRLTPLAVAYVLMLAVAGPLVARFAEPALERRLARSEAEDTP